MESKEQFEDLALKKSILPVLFYFGICFVLFFAIDQVSIRANNFLGSDNVKLVNILKGLVIGLLTTFLIFFLVYKYKYVEINAIRNMDVMVNSAPYPMLVVKLKDFSIASCSPVLNRLLGYTAKEMRSLTLRDIISESSFKILMNENENKHYVDKDFNEIHFVEKSKGLLALSANLLKYELLDTDYLLLRLQAEKISAKAVFEENSSAVEQKKTFQF